MNEYNEQLEKIEAELEQWLLENMESGRIKEVLPGICPSASQLGESGYKSQISAVSLDALFKPAKDMLSRGGKRWRPLLMTLVCESLGGGEASLPLAPLVEFSHNASLIHDDIEDDSDERRGKPAIHKTYGVDTAINSGSFLYFLSLTCIENCGMNDKHHIYKLWAECMRRLHLGQAMDISWHKNISFIPGIDEYYTMCALKTGCLSRFAAELGVYAAHAPDEAAQQLSSAAEKVGIGFQIMDDVKNLTTGIPGKRLGDDLIEGKKSLPVLLYLHRYPEKREQVFYTFHSARANGAAAPEVKRLIQSLEAAGILAEATEKGKIFIKEAREIINSLEHHNLSINEKSRALLVGLIDKIS